MSNTPPIILQNSAPTVKGRSATATSTNPLCPAKSSLGQLIVLSGDSSRLMVLSGISHSPDAMPIITSSMIPAMKKERKGSSPGMMNSTLLVPWPPIHPTEQTHTHVCEWF